MQQMQEKGVKIIVKIFEDSIKTKDYKFLKIKPEDMKRLWSFGPCSNI